MRTRTILHIVVANEGQDQFSIALSSRALMELGATDINTTIYAQSKDPRHDPCRRGTDLIMVLGGNQATLACSSLSSPFQICLCPQHMKNSLSLSPSNPLPHHPPFSNHMIHLLTIVLPSLSMHVGLLVPLSPSWHCS